nr:hypothetical protein [Tanacetum cinerariifolium]
MFVDTHNMVAYLSQFDVSEGFDQIVDFLNAHTIQYALVVNPTIYVSCIKQFWATATIKKCLSAKRTAWNEFSCSMASTVICLATEEEEEVEMPIALAPPSPTSTPSPPSQDPTPTPHATPHASPPQEQPTLSHDSTMPLLTTLMETWEKIEAIDANEDITLVDIEKDEEVVTKDAEPQRRVNQEEVNAVGKRVSAAEPTVFDDEEREYNKVQTLFKPNKDVEEPKKKRVADETLFQESFKKLKAVEVSGSESTQEIPSNDPKETSKEDVQNMLEIDAEPQRRVNQEEVNAVGKRVSAAEPTVFDDEEEVLKAAAKDKQEKDDMERAQVLQKQYDDKEENIDWNAVAEQIQERHLDNIRKYQSLKKKPETGIRAASATDNLQLLTIVVQPNTSFAEPPNEIF